MVFNVKPGRCLDVKKNILSKDLIVVAANKFLFFSTQQMNHSHVVSLIPIPRTRIVDLLVHKPKK
jgi:hypothetical protein